MTVEPISCSSMNEKLALQEAASTGLKSMEHLIRLVSHEPVQVDCREITNFAVSKFKKAISMLDRTGHARFRRGPVHVPVHFDTFTSLSLSLTNDHRAKETTTVPTQLVAPPSAAPVQTGLTLDFTKPNVNAVVAAVKSKEYSFKTMTTNSSSFLSSITGEGGSVSKGSSSMLFLPVPAGKDLLMTEKRCRKHEQSGDVSGNCQCKKRKFRDRKVIRVPAISSKIADIPADEFSWRKYGQKPIKGSKYPRGYYKCSSVRGCPARKHVERAMDDPSMLIVTYEEEHRHTQFEMQENNSQIAVFE